MCTKIYACGCVVPLTTAKCADAPATGLCLNATFPSETSAEDCRKCAMVPIHIPNAADEQKKATKADPTDASAT